jgi:periplasmic protein TonB
VDPQDQKRKPPSLLSKRTENPTPAQPMPSVQTAQSNAAATSSTKSSALFIGIATVIAAILVTVLVFRFVFNREPAELIQDTRTLADTNTIQAEASENASTGRASVYRAEDIDDIEPNTPATLPTDSIAKISKNDGKTIVKNDIESLKSQSPETADMRKPTSLEKALLAESAGKSSATTPIKTAPKTPIQAAPIAGNKPSSQPSKPAPTAIASAPVNSKTASTASTSAKAPSSQDSDVELLESLMDQTAAKEKTAPAPSKEKTKENTPTAAETTSKEKTNIAEKPPAAAKPEATREAVAQTKPAPEPKPSQAPERISKRKLIIVSSAEPKYPTAALRANVTGQVTASMTVNTDGRVSDIKIVNAKPRVIFDRSVKDALMQWRFEPIKEAQTITRTFGFSPDSQKNNAKK